MRQQTAEHFRTAKRKLDGVRSLIDKSIRNNNSYKGFTFVEE